MSSAQYLMQSHLPTGDVRLQPKESTTAEAYKNYRMLAFWGGFENHHSSSSLPPSSKVDAYKSTLRIGDKGGLNPETTVCSGMILGVRSMDLSVFLSCVP